MQLWVKFGHWVGMTVTQWRKAQQMWSVQFFYISKTNLENHIKIHHGENPTSVASAILQHLKQQILKIIWRYKVEENPTSVASAILQHLKQQILTIIWRCIVEENPTSVASVNLQSLKQPGWELILGYRVGKSPTNVIIVCYYSSTQANTICKYIELTEPEQFGQCNNEQRCSFELAEASCKKFVLFEQRKYLQCCSLICTKCAF